MNLTDATLKAAFPTLPASRRASILANITPSITRFDISTPKRLASFLGQTAHESALWSRKIENLNYSAAGLRSVFGKYFPTDALANAYARQPAKIANRAYGGRMGNGPEASGDGWRFRGKGFIQLTGRDNVTAFAKSMGLTIEQAIVYLESDAGAWMSAAWFWDRAGLNAFADKADVVTVTKRINGGKIGLKERVELTEAALRVLG